METADKSKKSVEEVLAQRESRIMSATSVQEVFNIIENEYWDDLDEVLADSDYDKHYKLAFSRALELADNALDAWRIFVDFDIEEPEKGLAFKKAASFPISKKDLEEILLQICVLREIKPDLQKCFLQLFKLGQESSN